MLCTARMEKAPGSSESGQITGLRRGRTFGVAAIDSGLQGSIQGVMGGMNGVGAKRARWRSEAVRASLFDRQCVGNGQAGWTLGLTGKAEVG